MKDRPTIKVQEEKHTDSQELDSNGCVAEVFKTNVERETEAKGLVEVLQQRFPGSRVNFDLQDRDRILRVEGKDVGIDTIVGIMETAGFTCTALD
jgi:hypothetical protein